MGDTSLAKLGFNKNTLTASSLNDVPRDNINLLFKSQWISKCIETEKRTLLVEQTVDRVVRFWNGDRVPDDAALGGYGNLMDVRRRGSVNIR